MSDNGLLSSGGRVIAVSALGDDLHRALAKAKNQAENISFEGKYYRRDIGYEF